MGAVSAVTVGRSRSSQSIKLLFDFVFEVFICETVQDFFEFYAVCIEIAITNQPQNIRQIHARSLAAFRHKAQRSIWWPSAGSARQASELITEVNRIFPAFMAAALARSSWM